MPNLPKSLILPAPSRYLALSEAQLHARSLEPVMIRDLCGNITFWNRAAENKYGWSKAEALGNVSHHLLETIFPTSLEEINSELVNTGFWRGELIHKLSDGTRVRVKSYWELVHDGEDAAANVVEVNSHFCELNPDTSHFTASMLLKLYRLLNRNKWWWLAPFITTVLLYELIIEFTFGFSIFPFSD